MLGYGVAVDALAFFGKPLEKRGRVGHFALGLGERLALLGGHQRGKVLLVRHHQFVEPAQPGAALLGGQRAPGGIGRLGGGDSARRLTASHAGHGPEHCAVGRIGDLEPVTGVGVHPLTVDVTLLTEQRFVAQLHGISSQWVSGVVGPAPGLAPAQAVKA